LFVLVSKEGLISLSYRPKSLPNVYHLLLDKGIFLPIPL
jgi:hypothetical protein